MAVIGEFRSDLSITRKTDGNFGNVSAGVFFSKELQSMQMNKGHRTEETNYAKLNTKHE